MNITAASPALTLKNSAAWLWAALFVAGNLLFPKLCHMIPDGGKTLLPIMLFTLVATVRFGVWCGLLTALASPLASTMLFGMPSGTILAAVLVKSIVIALAFGLWKEYKGNFTPWNLLLLVALCQLICLPIEGLLMFGMAASWNDLLLSWPGMLLQWITAIVVVKYWK